MRHKLKAARLLLGYESPTQIAADAGMTREGFRHIEKGSRAGQGASRVAILSALRGRRDKMIGDKQMTIHQLQHDITELEKMAIDETLFEEGDGDVIR